MYWELRYQQGELRAQLLRAPAPTPAPDGAPMQSPEVSMPGPIGESFVPLSSLKR
jgi:hypothetical protein